MLHFAVIFNLETETSERPPVTFCERDAFFGRNRSGYQYPASVADRGRRRAGRGVRQPARGTSRRRVNATGGADLSRANLSRADLGGADLGGAYLGEQWIIQGATRSDGYAFFLQKLKGDSEPMIKAGCRYFTLAQAESHWTATRGKTPLGRETEAIVRSMVSIAHIRGLMTEAKAVAA